MHNYKPRLFLDGRSIAILMNCPTLNGCCKAIFGPIFKNKVSTIRLRIDLSDGVLLLKIKRKMTELHSSKRNRSPVIDC